ncbi:MAG: carboxylesterase/lipase family protein [Lachnospiraceae bacterium]|nr:carboxylesterase/lipase family protein [Lachnospiraceae bacterium]
MTLIRQTAQGPAEGFSTGRADCWFGIPFAKPPVGELRFKRAREPQSWEGVRACTEMGPRPHDFLAGPMLETEIFTQAPSEDCLYLNVWAPKGTEPGAKKPVFVWIYGGANHTGEASNPLYDLSAFAEDDIVAVNLNYRLGPLGFYDFTKYGAEGFESNCALSDQIAALKWVNANIEAFGGDPGNVTICGESAGGMSCYALLASPAARGLFRKAIPMSGIADNIDYPKVHELNNALYFEGLGIDPSKPEELEKLKAMTPEELRGGCLNVLLDTDVYPGIELTGMVSGDDLLPDKVWDALEKGNAADVKVLIGTCRDEATLFYPIKMVPYTPDMVRQMLEYSNHPERFGEFEKVYGDLTTDAALIQIGTDRLFWNDSVRCSDAQAKHNTVWRYRFDFVTPQAAQFGLFATHSADIGPALKNSCGAQLMMFDQGEDPARLEKIREILHGAFVNFVKNGDPAGTTGPEWKPYTRERRETMLIDVTAGGEDACTLAEDPRGEVYDALWADLRFFEK